ncbi:hypothetical protein XI06_20945 [Bradyrhizobium sp. CCBAU 11434]|jgi:hypothetical protein|uniref:hypothetical protein n=1 Tax=Bradyrhizobium sp. CCBAU 11434 TaxID=1630885 RepID=UPI002305F13B|nr:hypothetical protein [Bradyrhizobium sp. CCBAU 11434]MDA9522682.1 hypothetical protein [Bradyrhizobium sp. CCBAU 11434]
MLPEIVTFWHGPMDTLRQTCLRSQLAAGHKVTVYSFDTIPGLPAGVENADAEAILPHAFSERLRPPQPDGSWRDWTTLQFSDFFRMKLMAKNLGLWLDADVLLLKPVEIDPAKPYFAWERSRRLGNSVLYLPQDHQIVRAFEGLMEQEELTPEWLSLSHRLSFAIKRLSGGSQRLSDLRIAIFGPPALTILAKRSGDLQKALPKKSFYAVHSEPRLFFDPSSYLGIITDPQVIGLHISGKGRSLQPPIPGSLFAWAVERFR